MGLPLKVRLLNSFRNFFRVAPFEAALASLTFGRPPDSFFAKFAPNPYQYRPNSFRTIERNGLVMKVDISDYIGHWIYFGFMDESIDKLFALCKSDSVVIDVGTNVGWTLLNLARLSKEGTVVGFEPDPYNYERCCENLALNQFKNAKLLPLGLSDMNAVVTMEVRTSSNRGGNRISQSTTGHPVQVVRLDDYQQNLNLKRLDLIKIDIEGHELHALKGADQLLTKYHPVLFIEVDDSNLRDQGHSARELIAYLFEKGYVSIVVADDNRAVNTSTDFTNCHFDIIAR
jgi:FkbM family methyltransferase